MAGESRREAEVLRDESDLALLQPSLRLLLPRRRPLPSAGRGLLLLRAASVSLRVRAEKPRTQTTVIVE